MAKIIIINCGFHGHVNPTLAITQGLVRSGHDVLYLCSAEFAAAITPTGARFKSYPSSLPRLMDTIVQRMFDPKCEQTEREGLMGEMLQATVADWEEGVPAIVEILKEEAPDLVVYEFIALAGRIAVQLTGLRAAQMCSTYASNEAFSLKEVTRNPLLQPTPLALASAQARADALTHRLGVPKLDVEDWLAYPEQFNLVFVPPSLQPEQATFDQRYHFIGPSLRESAPVELRDYLPQGSDPLLMISLGTIFNQATEFFKTCIESLSDLPLRIVLSIGYHVAPTDLGPLPENVRVHQTLPQIALLQKCRAFVTHCGMNSTMEALSFGVPLVCLPQMGEQELTARRVQELGLGLHLNPQTLTGAALRAAVVRVLEEGSFTAAARVMAAELKSCGGAAMGVKLIEALAKK